jgi:hypothetical protein
MSDSFGLCLVVAVILSVPRMQFIAPGEDVTALQPLKQFSPNEGRRTGWTIGGSDRWRNANTPVTSACPTRSVHPAATPT